MKYYIYTLSRGGNVFYVGYTSNLKTRLASHSNAMGKTFSMDVIQEYFGAKSTVLILETFWIKHYLDNGAILTNSNKTKEDLKHTYTFTCRPSIRQAAMKKAHESGTTLSEVIDLLLERYAGDKSFLLPKKTVLVFEGQEIELK